MAPVYYHLNTHPTVGAAYERLSAPGNYAWEVLNNIREEDGTTRKVCRYVAVVFISLATLPCSLAALGIYYICREEIPAETLKKEKAAWDEIVYHCLVGGGYTEFAEELIRSKVKVSDCAFQHIYLMHFELARSICFFAAEGEDRRLIENLKETSRCLVISAALGQNKQDELSNVRCLPGGQSYPMSNLSSMDLLTEGSRCLVWNQVGEERLKQMDFLAFPNDLYFRSHWAKIVTKIKTG